MLLARLLGAEITVDAQHKDVVTIVQSETGGAHSLAVTAVSLPAFTQAIAITRRSGTCALVGLPPGEFPAPLFDVVLKRLTIRGSLLGLAWICRTLCQLPLTGTSRLRTEPLERQTMRWMNYGKAR